MTGLDSPRGIARPDCLRLGTVSAVMVVEAVAPTAAALKEWGQELAEIFEDIELVVIANGVSSSVTLALEDLATEVPDLTIQFLASPIDRDAAYLVGLDIALGDWLILAQPRAERLRPLSELVARAREGYQVVTAVGPNAESRGLIYAVLEQLFFQLYVLLTGWTMLRPAPVMRLYSRAAAQFITASAHGEMLLKAASVAGGFPSFISRDLGIQADEAARRSWRNTVSKAVQELLTASTLPLRAASLIALLSGGLSLVYSLYVVGIYLFKPDVLPGWTTLSMQISGMMFLFSMLLAVMSEYLVGIYRTLAPRRRYVVSRELRSRKRWHANRLNVVDQAGSFRLGMPDEFAS